MDQEDFEQYRFLRLYAIDFDTALHTIRTLKRYKRPEVRYPLLRDIAVTYARPFSVNKGLLIPKHQLKEKDVPKSLRPLHKELLRVRREQFAHTDLSFYKPKVSRFGSPQSPQYWMSFKGYDYGSLDRQLSDIENLVRAVEQSIQQEIHSYESQF